MRGQKRKDNNAAYVKKNMPHTLNAGSRKILGI